MSARNKKNNRMNLTFENLEGRQLLAGVSYDAAFTMSGAATCVAGDTTKITSVAKNVGSTTMSNYLIKAKLGTRLSLDLTPSLDDIELVKAVDDSQVPNTGTIRPGDTRQFETSVKIPDNTPAGDYFVVFYSEDSPTNRFGNNQQFDFNMSNNLAYFKIHIDPKSPPPTVQSNTSMKLVGRVPGGLRGKTTTFTVQLFDANGAPIVGETVNFTDNCKYYGTRNLGSVRTDSSGKAVLTYTIPTNVNADNISMTASFAGNARYKAASYKVSHVEIGRN